MLFKRQRLGTNLLTLGLMDGEAELLPGSCPVPSGSAGQLAPPAWLALVCSSFCAGGESPAKKRNKGVHYLSLRCFQASRALLQSS